VERTILINSTPQEARVAILENNALVEIQIERLRERGIVGSIYKGKVVRILPGMQAAFVDIGLERAAFLPGSDFHPVGEDIPALRMVEHEPAVAEEERGFEVEYMRHRAPPPDFPIEERLSRGQEILVQVAKGPIGSKGARVTSRISLPGRYVVYMPTSDHLGVSRRIEDEGERERLRQIVLSLNPPEGGFIIRTVCEGLSKAEIHADLRFLSRLWQQILKKAEQSGAPSRLHYDMDLILRTIRDSFTNEVTKVLVDNASDFQRIRDFVDTFSPRLKGRVVLYEDPEPIFERYGIEMEIDRTLDRRVWLKSGGYIVIDQTEALTTIDVNTGRFVGRQNQEETVLKTNLEAAREIVDQHRLRNLGGIVIVDFIDMERPENREQVTETLRQALKMDRARTTISEISDLGLVEMTRKRTRESLEQLLCEPCPYCEGRGRIKSVRTIAYEILRKAEYQARLNSHSRVLTVAAHPAVARFLCEEESPALESLETRLGCRIVVESNERLDRAKYQILISEEEA